MSKISKTFDKNENKSNYKKSTFHPISDLMADFPKGSRKINACITAGG